MVFGVLLLFGSPAPTVPQIWSNTEKQLANDLSGDESSDIGMI